MGKREEWKKAYYESGPRKKFWVILTIAFIILVVGIVLVSGHIWNNLEEQCDNTITFFDAYSSGLSENTIAIPNSWENSFLTICTASKTSERDNISYYSISSCDLDKINNGLNNPNTLDLNDIRHYIEISERYMIINEANYLKGMAIEDISAKCDEVTAISSILYQIFYTSALGSAYIGHSGLMSVCISTENFTESERKECWISILDAEKSAVDYYLDLDYDGNMETCIKTLETPEGDIGSMFKFPIKNKLNSICQKLIDYRKRLVEEIRKSDIDYHQKYMLLVGLYLQEGHIGKGNYTEVIEQSEKNIRDRISQEYRPLFS